MGQLNRCAMCIVIGLKLCFKGLGQVLQQEMQQKFKFLDEVILIWLCFASYIYIYQNLRWPKIPLMKNLLISHYWFLAARTKPLGSQFPYSFCVLLSCPVHILLNDSIVWLQELCATRTVNSANRKPGWWHPGHHDQKHKQQRCAQELTGAECKLQKL